MTQSIPRLSDRERTILDLLQAQELFGMQFAEESGGTLKRGTVYVTLARMTQKGFVTSRLEPLAPGAIGLPRRWYRLTGYGRRVLNAWQVAERAFASDDMRTGAA